MDELDNMRSPNLGGRACGIDAVYQQQQPCPGACLAFDVAGQRAGTALDLERRCAACSPDLPVHRIAGR